MNDTVAKLIRELYKNLLDASNLIHLANKDWKMHLAFNLKRN